MSRSASHGRRTVMFATVTPLASIFGSGFLIIVPVLERTLGALSIFGAALVCLVAWFAGSAVRHCVRTIEPMMADGSLDTTTRRIDRTGDAVIVVAYVISVALYLRIMAQYLVEFVSADPSTTVERVIACVTVAFIVAIGVTRGFHGLDLLERVALGVVLVIVAVLGVALLIHDVGQLGGAGVRLPPVPDVSPLDAVLVLGGVVITVQGFETVRYLADEYDRPTRIQASRIAQGTATFVYVGFVAVATPVMGLGLAGAGADKTLLDLTERVVGFLALPLVITAVLSQLSAATADIAAADGNLRGLLSVMRGGRAYLVSGGAAIVLAATVPTFTIIAVASRAFALYYGIQAVIALRTCEGAARKVGYGALAVLMVTITVLARPAG